MTDKKIEPKIYILHENNDWVVPLREALDSSRAPYEEWFLSEGIIDLSSVPPEGVFYNRMSASSHRRGHRWGPEYTTGILAWLRRHNRRIVNGPDAVRLEINKMIQYSELEKHGIRIPKTVAAIGKDNIMRAAQKFGDQPLILKHNRGGKGFGVSLLKNSEALRSHVESPRFEEPIDGITLLQEYIESPQPLITRVEFVGGKLMYAVEVDTSEGFNLCPADSCQVGSTFCPTTDDKKHKFTINKNFNHPITNEYAKLLKANDIEIAGIEFIVDKRGYLFTYDINTNTNYNSGAEERASIKEGGMMNIAKFLIEELNRVKTPEERR